MMMPENPFFPKTKGSFFAKKQGLLILDFLNFNLS
jgi:hypothetical protein